MNIDRAIYAIAGMMIVASVLLSIYHNQNWLWLTGFVGLNLLQSSLTGFCPMVFILKAAGLKPGHAFK
jgi:hypothetical protein